MYEELLELIELVFEEFPGLSYGHIFGVAYSASGVRIMCDSSEELTRIFEKVQPMYIFTNMDDELVHTYMSRHGVMIEVIDILFASRKNKTKWN